MKTKFKMVIPTIAVASALALSLAAIGGPGYAGAPAGAVATDNMPPRMAQTGSGTSYGYWAKNEPRGPMTEGSDRYGSPAGDMPYDREIRLGSSARGVNVAHNETIKFVTVDGREFRWRFDTLRTLEVFPLSRIAPADVAVHPNASVHVTGAIPISP